LLFFELISKTADGMIEKVSSHGCHDLFEVADCCAAAGNALLTNANEFSNLPAELLKSALYV